MVSRTWLKHFQKLKKLLLKQSIRKAIEELASIKDKAMLASLGIDDTSSDSDVDVPDELESDDSSLYQVSSETRARVICALRQSAIGLRLLRLLNLY